MRAKSPNRAIQHLRRDATRFFEKDASSPEPRLFLGRVNGELTSRYPPTRPTPSATDAANDPETAKTLHSTIRWNKIADVKIMVDSEALANVADRSNGNRPLHIAAQNGHLELTKFLVSAGADVNAQNKGGQTAMHMATSYDLDQIVKVLNDAGADGSLENNDGFEARWGLSGEKDPTSTNYHVEQFQGASDEATLAKCLDALLKKAEAGEVDKQTFPAVGLKVKKANAASGAWTPAVQAKFVAVVQAEPPSFG